MSIFCSISKVLFEQATTLKDEGNLSFKLNQYSAACLIYEKSISLLTTNNIDVSIDNDIKTLLIALYLNRAICFLKQDEYQLCLQDCEKVLKLSPTSTKALYRSAQSNIGLLKVNVAIKDLQKLLHIDPKNIDAINLMRSLKVKNESEKKNTTEVGNILLSIENKNFKNDEDGFKSLIGLILDDKIHAMDFGRRNGITIFGNYMRNLIISFNAYSEDNQIKLNNMSLLFLKILSALCSYEIFIKHYIHISILNKEPILFNNKLKNKNIDYDEYCNIFTLDGKINLYFLSSLIIADNLLSHQTLILLMRILKSLPISKPVLIDENNNTTKDTDDELIPFLDEYHVKHIINGFLSGLTSVNMELFSTSIDAYCAFLSETSNYFGTDVIKDNRLESNIDRKARFKIQKLTKRRSKENSQYSFDMKALNVIFECLDNDNSLIRQRSAVCLGRMIQSLDNDDYIKLLTKEFLFGNENDKDKNPPSLLLCRKRAQLESALLMTSPNIGVWSLEQIGGIHQILFLIASQDIKCQEVAAEVMCLAASTEIGGSLLAPILSSGALHTLLNVSSLSVRAAAASTITKLSIKAKALKEDSPEISQILNAVLDVLKNSPASTLNFSSSNINNNFVSFFSQDKSYKKEIIDKDKPSSLESSLIDVDSGNSFTSTERAIEILAAIIGKTYIKEEIVHGSFRVASALLSLSLLELDVRSTAAYGLAYIYAALSVTNWELKKNALVDKDMSPEQYDQINNLQKIHTKDQNGNEIGDVKEDNDPDTFDMCKLRIQRISSTNGIPLLVRLLSKASSQTKETSARALRQICVEESSRGYMIQQGGLNACCIAASDEALQKSTRLEAAHAVAKTLITTNPNLLTEHVRLSTISPLVLLCRDVDSKNLQQFEALLALTNILSCGQVEQNRVSKEKGISAVHYLMFSNHNMVRRAATEAMNNIASHEDVLSLLRTDKIKLWLGFCEDFRELENIEVIPGVDNVDMEGDNNEYFMNARAAAGTLAVACADLKVCNSMLNEDCARTIVRLLNSSNEELVHRALIIIMELVETGGNKLAIQLIEGNVIPAIAIVSKMSNKHLLNIAKDTATTLSKAMKNEIS